MYSAARRHDRTMQATMFWQSHCEKLTIMFGRLTEHTSVTERQTDSIHGALMRDIGASVLKQLVVYYLVGL